MKVKFWGVRGSLPTPPTPDMLTTRVENVIGEFLDAGCKKRDDISKFFASLPANSLGGYGGNTACVEVFTDSSSLIVDGGSGLRLLGYKLMGGPCAKGAGEVNILFTHFHWDHLIGLPFFVPIFIPGNKINVYSPLPNIKDVFRTLFKKPYFPIPLEGLGATILYHELKPRTPVDFGGIEVTPYMLDHPDPCWGYKFKHNNKVYSHCVDTECTRVSAPELGEDIALYQGVDLMAFDAQYTLMETIEKVNWGHAAATLGLDLAMREGIKRVIFMHHEPASPDDKIAASEAQTRRYYEGQLKQAKRANISLHEVDWEFAKEGMVVTV